MPASDRPSENEPAIRETRYPLRALLKEVAAELKEGTFGQEKLRSQDVRKIFRRKTNKPRALHN